MKKIKQFNWFVLGLVSILIFAGCESKVLIATPLADAGADQNVAKSDLVTLDGSGSVDPNADPLTYLWTMDPATGRPAGSSAALNDVTAIAPTFTADLDGTYTITLVVSDGATSSPVDTVVISVANTAPVANAGLDQPGIAKNQTVLLDGSGSFDANGDTFTYIWTIFSIVPTNPADVSGATIIGPTTVNPTIVPDVAGVYTIRLIVNDLTVDSTPDDVVITVTNTAPVAIAAGTPNPVHTGEPTTLDSAGSNDPNVDGISYVWSIITRPDVNSVADVVSLNAAATSFTPDAVGAYTVRLVVTDDDSIPASTQVDFTLNSGNNNPVANAGGDQAGRTGTVHVLDGSGSSDLDVDNFSYSWTIFSFVPLNPPGASGAVIINPGTVNPTITTDVDGTYTIQLAVNDGFINSTDVLDTMIITATANVAPTAAIAVTPGLAVATGATVNLDGSGSSDINGDPLTYSWTVTPGTAGSGYTLSSATAVAPTFVPDDEDTYTIELIVNDGLLPSVAATVIVTATNDAPVASAGLDQVVQVALNATATLDGSGSLILEPNGDGLIYLWSIQTAPAGSLAALSSTAVVMPTLDPDELGDYTIRLQVTDDDLNNPLSSTDMVIVTAVIPAQDTGQTGDYAGTPVADEDSDFSSIFQPSYTDNGATVTDNLTGLLWQQFGDAQIGNWYEATGTFDATHNNATTDVCGVLGLDGQTWRLPSREELSFITNYGVSGPAVHGVFTPVAVAGAQHWTSDFLDGVPAQAWYVDLSLGSRTADAKTVAHDIICVCDSCGTLADGGYTTSVVGPDTIVTDGTTGLVWQQQGSAAMVPWLTALSDCEGLDFAGAQDWRLPNVRELASITDVTASGPATPPEFSSFSNLYWTSTTDVANSVNTWVLNFTNGEIETLGKAIAGGLTRCVRGGQ